MMGRNLDFGDWVLMHHCFVGPTSELAVGLLCDNSDDGQVRVCDPQNRAFHDPLSIWVDPDQVIQITEDQRDQILKKGFRT